MDWQDNKKEQKNDENHIRKGFISWMFLSIVVVLFVIFPLKQNFLIAINGVETTGTVTEVQRPTRTWGRTTRGATFGRNTINVEYFTGGTQRTANLRATVFSRVRAGDTITLIYSPQNPTSVTMRPAWFSGFFVLLSIGMIVKTFFVLTKLDEQFL